MYKRKENGKKKGLSLEGSAPNLLSTIIVMGLFIITPRNLGAFYLPTGDSGESGRINSASPIGESEFKPPVLASEEKRTEVSGLTPLTPEEVATYQRYQKVIIATADQDKQVINIGGTLYWLENKNPQTDGPTLPVEKNLVVSTPSHKPKPPADESQPQKQVPAGIEKQGDNKHPDEGQHLGWEEGKHKGWEKKPDNEGAAKLKELDLNLVGRDLKAKGQKEIKPQDKALKEKPKLEFKNLPKPVNKDDLDSLGIPRQINELKLENGESYNTAPISGPQDRIKIKSLPIGVR